MRASFSGLWREPEFMKLWAAQTVSQFGSQITLLGLPLTALLMLDATAAEMGILSAAATAPFVLIGLFAGVWVDRLRRRPILIATDLGRAILLAGVPVLAALDLLRIEHLYVVAFLTGVLTVFFDVAYQSYLPALVGRAQLVDANGKLEASRSAAQIAGPGIAGVLVKVLSAPGAILADAASYLLSAVFLLLIRSSEQASPKAERSSVWRDIGEGLGFVGGRPLLRSIAGATALANLFNSAILTIYLLYLSRELGIGPGLIGVIVGLGSAGFLIGSTLAGRMVSAIGLGGAIIAGLAVAQASRLPLAFVRGQEEIVVPLLIALQFLFGFGAVIFNINQVSLRQAITPDHLLGRMNATMRFALWGTMPLGALLGGSLAGAIGLRPTLILMALGGLVSVAWLWLSPVRYLADVDAAGAGVSAVPAKP